jgi:hypothetical protein
MIALIAGVAMLVISFALNIVGSIAQPIGNIVAIPNGHGGFNYLPQGGYNYPYQSLIPIGQVFLVTGLITLSIGVLMARQRMMKTKETHGLSPYLMGSDAWRVYTMIESQSRSDRPDSSPMKIISDEPPLAVADSSGSHSEVQNATSAQESSSSSAESKVVRPRSIQWELELHLSQLRFCRDNGLLTRKEYEEKRKELIKEFQLDTLSVEGPLPVKY